MDTELARTFLVVIATGSFVEAAQRLHVTQSTVSTRIQRLEETLGAELFVRNKAGTTLTPAGQQFQRHAASLTRTVEQARQEIGVVSGFRATLTVGGRIGLWEDLLLRWLPVFASLAPDVAVLRAVAGMLPPSMNDLKRELNTIHTLVACRTPEGWLATLFQSTPAAWHGRPGDAEALLTELREVRTRGRTVGA